jgi:hypothetical protein
MAERRWWFLLGFVARLESQTESFRAGTFIYPLSLVSRSVRLFRASFFVPRHERRNYLPIYLCSGIWLHPGRIEFVMPYPSDIAHIIGECKLPLLVFSHLYLVQK